MKLRGSWIIGMAAALLAVVVGGASALERFDRSSVLPDLAKTMKQVQSGLKDYSVELEQAKDAMGRLGRGYKALPAGQREVAKANDLVLLEQSCEAMDRGLEGMKGVFGDLKDQVDRGLLPRFGQVGDKLDALAKQARGQLEAKAFASKALDRVGKLSPGDLSEQDAKAINDAAREVKRRQSFLVKLQERRARVTQRRAKVEEKAEGVELVLAAIDVRQAEVQLNLVLARALQAEHQSDLMARQLFGAGGAAKILDDDTLDSGLDGLFEEASPTTGTSGNERGVFISRTTGQGGGSR